MTDLLRKRPFLRSTPTTASCADPQALCREHHERIGQSDKPKVNDLARVSLWNP
jgi:hypothetical protein